MKPNSHRFLLPIAAAALFTLAGCDTFNARAKQKSETYEALPPPTQQRLKKGQINAGDTQDMVYIALGNPDEKRQISTNNGNQEVWIYRTYWEQYEGTAWVGWHRTIVPMGRGYAIFHESVPEDIYRTHVDEVIRVMFDHGVVSSVEQRRR